MLIAILVLLGIAGAIWYFARQQAQAVVTLTQEDVNVTSVTNESAFTTPEVASEKEFIQAQQDAEKKTQDHQNNLETEQLKAENKINEIQQKQ